MLNKVSLSQFKVVLDQSKSVLVMLGANSSLDQAASAVSFYESLKDLKSDVNICSPEEISFLGLQGQDKIKNKLGSKDLSVSFDYDETSVDKVSYHIDETKGKFYLIVKPKKGHKPLDTKSLTFDYVGAQADVIVLFGVHQYNSLEHLYTNYGDVYSNATVVTIHNFETEIGDIKIDVSGKSCWSETVLSLIEQLGLELNGVAATNLLYAIEDATNNLSSFAATADTFEVVAKLMRAGARRLHPRKDNKPKEQGKKTSFEVSLEKAKTKKKQIKKETQSVKEILSEKKKTKSKKNNNNQMRNKDYIPDNLGRRV